MIIAKQPTKSSISSGETMGWLLGLMNRDQCFLPCPTERAYGCCSNFKRYLFKIHNRKTKLVLSYDLKPGKAEKFFQFRLRRPYERWMKGCDQRVFMYHNSMVKLPSFVNMVKLAEIVTFT